MEKVIYCIYKYREFELKELNMKYNWNFQLFKINILI